MGHRSRDPLFLTDHRRHPFVFDIWKKRESCPPPSPVRTHDAAHRHLLASAALRDVSLPSLRRRASQQTPGLPVHFKHPTAFGTVIKMHGHPRHKRICRNHIPQILSNHVRRQKINVLQRVDFAAPRGPCFASRTPKAGRALHLHPPQPPSAFHRKVIRTAVSPRLQHRKSQHRCLRQERSLHRFSQPLARRHIQPQYSRRSTFSVAIFSFRHKKSAVRVS